MTEITHIEVLREMLADKSSTLETAKQRKSIWIPDIEKQIAALDSAITALSARASAGEGGELPPLPQSFHNAANQPDRQLWPREKMIEYAREAIAMNTAAPQPAPAGASGGVRIKTKGPDDFASHVCPAESSAVWNACVYEHDRIAEGLPPILSSTEVTPASPATGDDPCIECGADPGEACYPNCCTQTPQPAAPQPQEKE